MVLKKNRNIYIYILILCVKLLIASYFCSKNHYFLFSNVRFSTWQQNGLMRSLELLNPKIISYFTLKSIGWGEASSCLISKLYLFTVCEQMQPISSSLRRYHLNNMGNYQCSIDVWFYQSIGFLAIEISKEVCLQIFTFVMITGEWYA